MNPDLAGYVEIFKSEAGELLESLNRALLELEHCPDELHPLEEAFRVAHTLKGMSATIGYDHVAELTHRMETVFDRFKKRQTPISAASVDLLFRCLDSLQELIGSDAGEECDLEPLFMELESIVGEGEGEAPRPKWYRTVASLSDDCLMKAVRAQLVCKRLHELGAISHTNLGEFSGESQPDHVEVVISSVEEEKVIRQAVLGIAEVSDVETSLVSSESVPIKTGKAEARHAVELGATVRVRISHLDTLLDVAGELLINHTRVETLLAGDTNSSLRQALNEQESIIATLQHEVLRARMVPVKYVFDRFPRMVRDIARQLRKEVRLSVCDQAIELDRTVLDEVGDLLLHVLRNAISHGIESPSHRLKSGKPRSGEIRLEARRGRGTVIIDVVDDGRGIDPAKVREVAARSGFIGKEEAAALSDDAVLHLICTPGFTTAQETTALAGRGVGLDAVKGKIEALGGFLRIYSIPGCGSTFTFELPLSLALVPALLVDMRGQVLAIPLSSVVTILRSGDTRVRDVGDGKVAIVGDEVIPLIPEGRIFGSDKGGEAGHLVILEVADVKRALPVQAVIGNHQVVVKPLNRLLEGIGQLGGATVLGDGRVALILDPRGLVEDGLEARAHV